MKDKRNNQYIIAVSLLVVLLILFPTFQSYQDTSSDRVVLITGFKPFDIYDVNPSEQIALELNNTQLNNVSIKGYVLSVDYQLAPQKMKQLIHQYDPELIISLGLAGKATSIRLEQVAVNLKVNPDLRFTLLSLKRVNKSGSFFQFSTFETNKMKERIAEKDISVEESSFAGLYLCNAILYETLFYLLETEQEIPMGFIHVPQLDSQSEEGMSLETMITAVTTAITAQIE